MKKVTDLTQEFAILISLVYGIIEIEISTSFWLPSV